MGKLKRMAPALRPLAPRVASIPVDRHATRDQTDEARGWYNSKAWRRLRWQVLVDALFTCARCGTVEANTARLVADHIDPHRGDEGEFWRRSNLQCLCKACHDGAKQREEAAARRLGL